jgi:hypothetical protein
MGIHVIQIHYRGYWEKLRINSCPLSGTVSSNEKEKETETEEKKESHFKTTEKFNTVPV